jgi:hypothetical protein
MGHDLAEIDREETMKSTSHKRNIMFLEEDTGFDLIEYAFAAILIAIGVFTSFTELGSSNTRGSSNEVVASEMREVPSR